MTRASLTADAPLFELVTHRAFAHHGNFSGYNQVVGPLSRQMDMKVSVYRLPVHRWDLVGQVSRLRAYCRGQLHGQHCTAHHIHIYPEQTLDLVSGEVSRTTAIFHQPASRYRSGWGRALRQMSQGVGRVVALGSKQADELREQGFNAIHIPHGVRSDVFMPAPNVERERTVVVSRGWLRDEMELHRAVDTYRRGGWNVQITGAGVARISDLEWRSLLQRSAIVMVPAPRAIGSNAVLEAMSSGCVVDGPLGSDAAEYLSPSNRLLILHGAMQDLGMDELQSIGMENRRRAELLFDWSVVAASLASAISKNRETE